MYRSSKITPTVSVTGHFNILIFTTKYMSYIRL